MWMVSGSFVWKFLIKIKNLFHWYATWEVGDGKLISFWYDNWMGVPIRALKDRLPRPVLQSASLDQAIMLITDLAPHVQPYTPVLLSQQVDKIIWRWSSNGGLYSANSVYKVLTAGGKVRWKYEFLWSCNAPIKVKIFAVLVLRERILTHDVMDRRGISCELRCHLCDSCEMENACHLLFECCVCAKGVENNECPSRVLVNEYRRIDVTDMGQINEKCFDGECIKKKEWATRFLWVLWYV